jgi:hypothetical protein
MSINDEENMKELLRAVYKPVSASPEFKDTLLRSLTDRVSAGARVVSNPLSMRPEFGFVMATAIILAVISYGIRLHI